jgi:hypothetical protein
VHAKWGSFGKPFYGTEAGAAARHCDSLGSEGSQNVISEVRRRKNMAKARSSMIRNVLSSESFAEKAALLILTALLSSLAFPFALATYDARATERQKRTDLKRAKDDSILQAQKKLVDDFATVIFTYETLALDVSWYKTKKGRDEILYRKAYTRYSERVPDLLSSWRSLNARSRTLTSPSISTKLNDFQISVFENQDTPMNQLNQRAATEDEWSVQHRRNGEMLTKADALITDTMNDIGLSKDHLQ